MHCTIAFDAIATTTTCCNYKVKTPQRKANYKNKERLRLKDLKRIAFKQYSCSSTNQIKQLLQQLGVKLDLRLTSAWDALVFELRSRLLELCSPIKPGMLVEIIDCPGNLYFLSPFKVYTVEADMAQLEYVASSFPLHRLQLWQQEEIA